MCLGHLFTYRDFKGTIGLAWVADPSEILFVCTYHYYTWMVTAGTYAGGICELGSNNPGGLKKYVPYLS